MPSRRTARRLLPMLALGLSALLLPVASAHAATQTLAVNTLADSNDGACNSTTCSLRDAIVQANADTGDTIQFSVTGTITLTSALPGMTQNTIISGPGADKLTVSGASAYSIFSVGSGVTASISGLTIANGKSAGDGGAIVNAGILTVSSSVLSGNSGAHGGGILNTGTLNVAASTLIKNAGSNNGGGIYSSSGSVTVTNSSFVGNSSANRGGGIYVVAGSLTVDNSTFWGNSAPNGGGIGSGGTLTLTNSILAESAGTSYTGVYNSGTVSKEEKNVFYGNAGSDANFTLAASDVTGQDPKLLPLGNYGGTTQTMLPLPGSPAICAGKGSDVPGGATTDQRGFVLSTTSCGSGKLDAGAVQTAYVTASGSLPSSYTGPEDVDLTGLSGTVSSSGITITGAVNLIGPGANLLTLSGGNANQVLSVSSGASATIYGVTVANGKNGSLIGGGIENEGTLTVLNSAVSDNAAGSGAGIDNGGTLNVLNSTISGNSAPSGNGGGISNIGLLTVVNSTFSGNTVVGGAGVGGAIISSGTLTVINSTFSGNSADNAGGIYVNGGSATVSNSIFADNAANVSGAGIGNSGTLNASHNVYYSNLDATTTEDDCKNCTSNANAVTASSEPLAVLGSYGGATQTMLPLPITTSAICAGSSSLALDANGNALTTDQRGFAVGAAIYCTAGKLDAGAVQTNYQVAQFTNSVSGYSALVGAVVSPSPILSITENGQNVGGIPVTLTFTGTGTATGLGPVTTVAGTGATFSSIKVDTAGATDTLSVSLGGTGISASADLEIDAPVALSPVAGALTSGTVGTAYSGSVTASGGKGGFTYARTTGALPDGLALNSSTGALTGTPIKAGSFSFTITATDTQSNTGSAAYTLAVSQATTTIAVTSADTTNVSEPSGSSFVGDSVTFTASLTPVGTGVTFTKGVAFKLDGTAVAVCSSQSITVASDGSSAIATCVIGNLTNGAHTVVASYPTGDANYASGTSSNFTHTVSPAGTSVAVISTANPSKVDDSVTFKATVTNSAGGSAPTAGTVAFTSDGTGISGCGAVALVGTTGTASCSINTLSAASSPHSIVAVYSGDTTSFSGSTSTALSQAVNKATSTVTVSTSGTPGVNQPVTFTASVTPIGPVALSSTGTMTFKDGATTISGCASLPVTAATGQAACTTTFTGASSHTITAVYSGDVNYAGATSGNSTVTVSKANTSVAITSLDTTTGVSGGNSNLNDSVTFTAVVTLYNGTTALSPPFTGAAALTGTMSFTSNGKAVCSTSVGIDSGTGNYDATCTMTKLPAGSSTIVASYSGDSNYNASNNNLTQNVDTATTNTSVVSSSATSTVNQTVTFTASVTPFNATTKLSGSVTFTSLNTGTGGTATICNAVAIAPATGQAQCQIASLTPGSYTVTASYGNDANYGGSSGSVSQTVGQAATTIALTSTPNPSNINQQVTLKATVSAQGGATALNGTVSFTDNGNAISGCPTGPINPNNPVVTCTTTGLALGANSLVASYGADSNFSNSSSTPVSQTVNAAPTTLGIASSAGSTTTVNQQVSFTATVSGAGGAVQFSGTMSFTDNGTAIVGCSALPVGPTTGKAVCSTSSLLKGAHTIAASYAGDSNFATSNGSLALTVNPAASTTALVSSLNPSIALNPNNYNDLVALTATVSPTSGVPLSGTMTFTSNGAPIAECQAPVPVNPSTGIASCSTASLGFGAHTILAVYNGDSNYGSSSGSITQSVQDYALTASPTSTVTVSQRFTNTTDPFTSQAISVSAAPISGFVGQLALTCNVVALSAPTGAVSPLCALGSSTLPITAGANQQPVAVTIDAGTGSTPVATPGTYNVSITGVDATTGLVRSTASFVVNVRFQAPPLTIVSGATTGNASSVQFTLPANVGITTMLCASVTGPTLTSSVAPVALGMGCTFDPSTIAAASTTQNVLVAVTVTTSGTTTARLRNDRTTIVMAGLLGVPLLVLLGLMPGGKSSRKILLRFMAIVFAVVMVMQATGCGGGHFTAPPSTSGQTPPGSYNILVQGTGTDGQVYQAVIQVNVTR